MLLLAHRILTAVFSQQTDPGLAANTGIFTPVSTLPTLILYTTLTTALDAPVLSYQSLQ